MPAPNTAPEIARKRRRPSRSEVRPSRAIATMEAAAPTKSATPNGPGERPKAPLRSANKTAKHPQNRPKKPNAPNATARGRRIRASIKPLRGWYLVVACEDAVATTAETASEGSEKHYPLFTARPYSVA